MTKITQKPDGTVSFELVLPKSTIAAEYQHVLKEVAATTQIKGFRPGKAPLAMVEAQMDKSKLYSHVLDHALSPAYSAVIHEHKLIPLLEPRVNPKSMEKDKDWVMSVEVAIAPEIKLGDYEKLVVSALKKHAKVHPTHQDAKPEEARDHQLNVIFDALLDDIKFGVSPLLVEAETSSVLARLAKQLTPLKLTLADYAKSVKKTPEELLGEYRQSATNNLKLEFVLQAIAREQKFEGEGIRRQTLDFLSAL